VTLSTIPAHLVQRHNAVYTCDTDIRPIRNAQFSPFYQKTETTELPTCGDYESDRRGMAACFEQKFDGDRPTNQ